MFIEVQKTTILFPTTKNEYKGLSVYWKIEAKYLYATHKQFPFGIEKFALMIIILSTRSRHVPNRWNYDPMSTKNLHSLTFI